ncbi:complex I NDUFA9 subunit family protein [Thiomicrorhabdus immobilis]|uniref:Complex I NDUFA9 subunit family protein n=1 Tax=Thiomicrorhabdus immobilis TaxID=2791037 RepID=A0ABM7MAY9_9GAMM|nr:NAD(P)H-binding protein [Thiomicrorhabdus immobilis]BCN92497.1 complex I NDUFA9 subunit family protein [Thiomicrorhabdus immobilis]
MLLGNKVSVFGGTGFVGRAVVNELSKAGYEIKVVVRRPERFREFLLYPNTTLHTLESFDNAAQLTAAVKGADIVINLITDRSTGTEMIEQADLTAVTQKIKSATESAGVKRVLSLSQIGASTDAPNSDWFGILGEVGNLMHNVASAKVTILKPSLLIGAGDDTTARFVTQLNRMDLLMVAQSNTVVQPLWIKDFAQAAVAIIKDESTFDKKLEMVGEERLTMKQLGELVAELMQKDAIVFPMCKLNAKLMAAFGAFAPIASVSKSQLLMLSKDMVSDADFETQFGFAPSSLEWAISTYASPHDIRERYNFYRKEAGRDVKELV